MDANVANILDVRSISTQMTTLHTLSITGAMAIFPLAFTLETVRQNINGLESKSDFGGFMVKALILMGTLSIYKFVFDSVVGLFFILENSLVGVDQWVKLLNEMSYYRSQGMDISWFRSSIPVFCAWTGSFAAIIIQQIVFWIQYGMLATFYFLGPFVLVAGIFEPAKYLVGVWFRNIVGVCLWSVFIKIIVVVMMQVEVLVIPTSGSLLENMSTVIAVSICFIVMMLCSVVFAEVFVNGKAVGSIAVVASSYLTGKSLQVGKLLDRKSWGPAANDVSNGAGAIRRFMGGSKSGKTAGNDSLADKAASRSKPAQNSPADSSGLADKASSRTKPAQNQATDSAGLADKASIRSTPLQKLKE